MDVNDTHPDMERKRIELLRAMTPDERGKLASQLSAQCHWRAKQAIATAHPELSDFERDLLFIEVQYGRELAERVRAYRLWKAG